MDSITRIYSGNATGAHLRVKSGGGGRVFDKINGRVLNYPIFLGAWHSLSLNHLLLLSS